ncbi:response regulator receiver domain [Janthinobacterium sp. LB3P112]|uniref:response regulator receiver domain n=1 Tax=Janthinobacterium sp. LB3P112 TaxID=3424196 RepID=UPI003F21CC0E
MAEAVTPNYGELIQEAFIDPIRSVIVVDDEFPTLKKIISNFNSGKHTNYDKVIQNKVLDIINFCGDVKRRWMVEVHDSVPEEHAGSVHQSDLMILDFHLDQSRPTEGTEAIRILRNLATNHHFNLVIVYTNGYDGVGNQIDKVVHEIAVSLSTIDTRLVLSAEAIEVAKEQMDNWEDYDNNINRKIDEFLDENVYLLVRRIPGDLKWPEICKFPEFGGLMELYEKSPDGVDRKKLNNRLFVKLILHRIQEGLKLRLATKEMKIGDVHFGISRDKQLNWIRTDQLFVTVVGKNNEPSVLPQKLSEALDAWNPEPHRLLMSKMRATLGRIGSIAEDEVLRNQHLQAGWLKEYIIADSAQRHSKVDGTISKHWDGMGGAVRADVMEFARKLTDYLMNIGSDAAMRRWYGSVSPEDVHSQLNWYACSKSVEGNHLNTGHVIEIPTAVPQVKEFWICLSPACDLVPGQKSAGWPKRLGKHLPFIAVELFPITRKKALDNAYGSNCLFLNIDGKLNYFSFVPMAIKENDDGRVPNPKWEQMFAIDHGNFLLNGSERKLNLVRAFETADSLVTRPFEGKVVAQLRYEYALNLLQKMGTNFSRIGLDFFEFSSPAEPDSASIEPQKSLSSISAEEGASSK